MELKYWPETWLQHMVFFSLLISLQFFSWWAELPLAGFWTQAFIWQGKDQDLKPFHKEHAYSHFQEKKGQCLSVLLIAGHFLIAYTSKCFQILPQISRYQNQCKLHCLWLHSNTEETQTLSMLHQDEIKN